MVAKDIRRWYRVKKTSKLKIESNLRPSIWLRFIFLLLKFVFRRCCNKVDAILPDFRIHIGCQLHDIDDSDVLAAAQHSILFFWNIFHNHRWVIAQKLIASRFFPHQRCKWIKLTLITVNQREKRLSNFRMFCWGGKIHTNQTNEFKLFYIFIHFLPANLLNHLLGSPMKMIKWRKRLKLNRLPTQLQNIHKGLMMLIGIIMYISLFKSEIGSKLRPKSVFQPPLFVYRYGHSFILFVIGCISAEVVGTLNFFLFIRIREIGRETVRLQIRVIYFEVEQLWKYFSKFIRRQFRVSFIHDQSGPTQTVTHRKILPQFIWNVKNIRLCRRHSSHHSRNDGKWIYSSFVRLHSSNFHWMLSAIFSRNRCKSAMFIRRIWRKVWTNCTRSRHRVPYSHSKYQTNSRWRVAYRRQQTYFRIAAAVLLIRKNHWKRLRHNWTNEWPCIMRAMRWNATIDRCRGLDRATAWMHRNSYAQNQRTNYSVSSARRLANDQSQRISILSIDRRTMMEPKAMYLSWTIMRRFGKIDAIRNHQVCSIRICRWKTQTTPNRMGKHFWRKIFSMPIVSVAAPNAAQYFWIIVSTIISRRVTAARVTRISTIAVRCRATLWSGTLILCSTTTWCWGVAFRPVDFTRRTITAWHWRRQLPFQKLWPWIWEPKSTTRNHSIRWPHGTVVNAMRTLAARTHCRCIGQTPYPAHRRVSRIVRRSVRIIWEQFIHRAQIRNECPPFIRNIFRSHSRNTHYIAVFQMPSHPAITKMTQLAMTCNAMAKWMAATQWPAEAVKTAAHLIWIAWNKNDVNRMPACFR